MRILDSDFHDYYDGVQQHGHDDHIVYNRVRALTEVKQRAYGVKNSPGDVDEHLWCEAHKSFPSLSLKRDTWGWSRHDVGFGILYFCGKIYPFFVRINHKDDTKAVYSFEDGFDEGVTQNKNYKWSPSNPTPYKQWLAENWGKEVDPGIHFHHNSPVILFYGKNRIVNPCLMEYRFQKVIDAYTAFQEIDMFMGGVLGSIEKEGPPLTDKEKVSAHGMDPKWSFRKHPDQDKK